VFGALITPAFLFTEIPFAGWIFAVLALIVASHGTTRSAATRTL